MTPAELAARMVKVGGADLVLAMAKAASAVTALPRAPRFGESRPRSGLSPSHVPPPPAPAPELDKTRPEAIAPQKTLTPPSI